VEPAYFFSRSGEDVRPFYSDLVKLDFRRLWMDFGSLRIGKLLPTDTGNLLLEPFSKGYDGARLTLEWRGIGYTFEVYQGEGWVSDGDYYFNPAGMHIREGERIARYLLVRRLDFGNWYFAEITNVAALDGHLPRLAAFNPLLPGYLYQWLYASEVNVLWEIGLKVRGSTFRLIIDDFPYLPSWLSIVPPTVGFRASGDYPRVAYDILWLSAFTYANRRPWDALYESPWHGSDYAQASLRVKIFRSIYAEAGLWAAGAYHGVYVEPEVGDYPPFAFLHGPVRWDGWLAFGGRWRGLDVAVGYGDKPNSLALGRIFAWFGLKLESSTL